MKNAKERIRHWCSVQMEWVKDYAREISVIILGLCITYYCDSLADGYVERREDRAMIRMICDELERNIGELKIVRQYYLDDFNMGMLIRGNHSTDFANIGEDSVRTYNDQFRKCSIWSHERHTFQVFQESAMPRRIEKPLLTQIFACYEHIEMAKQINADYREKRLSALVAYRADVPDVEPSTIGQWRQCCADKAFFTYLTQAIPMLSQMGLSVCNRSIELLEQTLAEIERQYPPEK